ncbi:MAG: hypothetical protein KDE63_01985 [Novosphingobium sp.]|nr:hypothetical protein [Novosphingobium sp.]
MAKRKPEDLDKLVLTILRSTGGRSLSAYGIAEAAPVRITPVQVYRTLDRLAQRRCVQRIECLNAWAALPAQANAISVCTSCEIVRPLLSRSIEPAILEATGDAHFVPARTVVEVIGLCEHCQDAD